MFRPILLVSLVTTAAVILTLTGALAVPSVLTLDTPNPEASGLFGYSVATGDADLDGKDDVLVGAPFEDVGANVDQGRAYLFSGATGALIRTLESPNPKANAKFGWDVAMGDADGDGRADTLVTAAFEPVGPNGDQGRAYLFSGATGAHLQTLENPSPGSSFQFGQSAAMGDADGDGKADLLIGNPFETVSFGRQGRAYLFDGPTGVLVHTLNTPSGTFHGHFAEDLAMGDTNGDGKADLLIGATQEGPSFAQGRAHLFDGLSGALIYSLDLPNPQGNAIFGFRLALGDATGDGRADALIGAPNENVGPQQGRAYLFDGPTGSLIYTLDSPSSPNNDHFGWKMAVGDVDGDAKGDLLVSSNLEDVGVNADQGRVYLYSGATGGLLLTLDTPNPESGGRFGYDLSLANTDGVGGADAIITAAFEDDTAVDQGRAYVFRDPLGLVPPTSATINVLKDFTDDDTGSVTVSITCTSGTVTNVDTSASEADDANFTVSGFTDPGTTCTATEGAAPVGYWKNESNCVNVAISDGGTASCTIVNTFGPPPVGGVVELAIGSGDEPTVASQTARSFELGAAALAVALTAVGIAGVSWHRYRRRVG